MSPPTQRDGEASTLSSWWVVSALTTKYGLLPPITFADTDPEYTTEEILEKFHLSEDLTTSERAGVARLVESRRALFSSGTTPTRTVSNADAQTR
jgi:hypothetical protein